MGKTKGNSRALPISDVDSLSEKFDSLLPLVGKFDSFSAKFDELRNEFNSSNVRVQACEAQGTALAADLNAVKADAGFLDPMYKANMANMLAVTQRLAIQHYNMLFYFDQPERAENARFRVLRIAVGTAFPPDLPSLSSFLCCAPSLITQATPQRPNGQGKARLIIQFKDPAAAATASTAFRASTNRTRAVLDIKRTRLQNARVGLAIQLQRVAREAGHEQATFRAEDGVGWDFIVYKESPTAAPMAYPYIHHFLAGEPPAQGSPYISVDTATVTELLNRLRPLHSYPKPPLVKPPTAPPPAAPPASGQTPPNNNPHNQAPPAAPPAPSAPPTIFQRPPPVPHDRPSTSRGLFQSLPSSRSHTPRKAPPPFKGLNKRQAVSNSPPSPSANSSPTRRRSPPRTTNTTPPPPPPPPPPLNYAQATSQTMNAQI